MNATSKNLTTIGQNLHQYGHWLIGKTAQISEVNVIGDKVIRQLSAPKLITDFEVIEVNQEPVLNVIIGGLKREETKLFNITSPKIN